MPDGKAPKRSNADAGERPSFREAKSSRHKARLAGMHPNYWYPLEWSKDVAPGKVVEAKWWGESIALYRTKDGEVRAVENRCPHRQIPLTMGHVRDCNLVCLYHGWSFDKEGTLVDMKHDHFGKKLPVIKIRSYPVQERYGIIWVFPGKPEYAEQVPLPEISVYDGPDRWAHLAFDYTWNAHHYMVIDNLCNLTHLYVHGNWVPYDDTTMHRCELEGDRLELDWHHTLRHDYMWPVYKRIFGNAHDENMSDSCMVYDYPYQRVMSNERIFTCNFMLPVDEEHTRVFTIQFWKAPKILGVEVPYGVMNKLITPLIRPVTREVFRQDGATVEGEQAAVMGEHFWRPMPEPNPTVKVFEKLTIDRWEAALQEAEGSKEVELNTQVKKLY